MAMHNLENEAFKKSQKRCYGNLWKHITVGYNHKLSFTLPLAF